MTGTAPPTDLEYRFVRADPGSECLSPLVFLHEGLGSADLWRAFPDRVRQACSARAMLVYSRRGHGRSPIVVEPRTADYMHREADVELPALLAAFGIDRPVLIGHSDGASIALLYAGAHCGVESVVVMAPHVFVEPEGLDGVSAARRAFETTDMAERMARHHLDATSTFRGWNDAWLSDAFRSWNIEDRLPAITAPVLAIQGTADQYGTIAQIDAIEARVAGAFRRLVLPDVGHAPHAEAADETLAAIAAHVGSATDRSSASEHRTR